MCKSKSEGGTRCEYADMLSNVRRIARNKYAGNPNAKRQVQNAVEQWKLNHANIVVAHLPETQPFMVKPKSGHIPEHLLNKLSKNSRTPITGLDAATRQKLTQQLIHEHTEWVDRLTLEEQNAIVNYTLHGSEMVNRFLRRKGLPEYLQNEGFLNPNQDVGEYSKQVLKPRVGHLDAALQKRVHKNGQERKLFRFFKVPPGVTAAQYMEKYFTEGGGFKEEAYMSTSADPEFIMAALRKKGQKPKGENFIVMEILTKEGQSLQRNEEMPGQLQSFEKEILLPRNMKFRIAGVRKSQKFQFGSDRDDLATHYYYKTAKKYQFTEGASWNYPVVQMVDEKLIP